MCVCECVCVCVSVCACVCMYKLKRLKATNIYSHFQLCGSCIKKYFFTVIMVQFNLQRTAGICEA